VEAEAVRALTDLDPMITIVVLTEYESITTAVDSVRLGATNDLIKPIDAD
jgi:ActR/RegA family two-component response regulator